MRILIMNDEGFPDLGKVAGYLREMSKNDVKSFQARISDTVISHPRSHKKVNSLLRDNSIRHDQIIVFTYKRYDNNFFYMGFDSKIKGDSNIVIVSMYGWDRLTTVDIMNGVVYMYCSVMSEGISEFRHEQTTGCLNDFLWDKSGVDVGMKMASFCSACRTKFSDRISRLGINGILDDLSVSSRNGQDIIRYWDTKSKSTNTDSHFSGRPSTGKKKYDVFLCHNSVDKEAIRDVNQRLTNMGISPWFDEISIPAGVIWQDELEQVIGEIKSVAVFVGENGIGPWHRAEMRSFIDEFATRRCPVIPVILPSCRVVPQLPMFLRNFMWVDLRIINPDPWQKLVEGISRNSADTTLNSPGNSEFREFR